MGNEKKGFQWQRLWPLVILLPIVLFFERRNSKEKKELIRSARITCGRIIGHERSGNSGTATTYEYWVNGARFEGVMSDKRFGDCMRTKSCIGLNYTVEYAAVNPANSRMIWTKPNCSILADSLGLLHTAQ